jgi:hypothetical protein
MHAGVAAAAENRCPRISRVGKSTWSALPGDPASARGGPYTHREPVCCGNLSHSEPLLDRYRARIQRGKRDHPHRPIGPPRLTQGGRRIAMGPVGIPDGRRRQLAAGRHPEQRRRTSRVAGPGGKGERGQGCGCTNHGCNGEASHVRYAESARRGRGWAGVEVNRRGHGAEGGRHRP